MNDISIQLQADENRVINIAHDLRRAKVLFIDISAFTVLLQRCLEVTSAKLKKAEIAKLFTMVDWCILHADKKTGNLVRAENDYIEHEHELITAKALTQVGYDVLFAPKGMFNRSDKKFDVFLIRDHVILRADLKSVSSKNPDTIGKRIKGGSDQASRVVVEIVSDIEHRVLVDGLRQGVMGNKLIKEILLFYRNRFYRLSKEEIISKRIYSLLK